MQQILQWLFKVAHERRGQNTKDQEDKSKDIIFSSEPRRSKSKKFKVKSFVLPCNGDVARACFYSISTIYLSRVRSSHRGQQQQHWARSMKMKKEDIARGFVVSPKPNLGTPAGNSLVLPPSAAASKNELCNTNEKKEKLKGDNKTKTMSRMKELLRWAAANKSDKLGAKFIGRKVLQFRNREALKAAAAAANDDQFSYESPKISFRWDVDSCYTTSSALSAISVTSSLRNDRSCNIVSMNSTPIHGLNRCSSQRGNWITTDSEFVVLEL